MSSVELDEHATRPDRLTWVGKATHAQLDEWFARRPDRTAPALERDRFPASTAVEILKRHT